MKVNLITKNYKDEISTELLSGVVKIENKPWDSDEEEMETSISLDNGCVISILTKFIVCMTLIQ